MSINVNTDYSTLFSSLGSTSIFGSSSSSSDSTSSTILADYASIKNGSYGKLCKAYYAKQEAEESSSSDSDTSASTSTASAAASLKSAASALTDDSSLFDKVKTTDEDGNETTDYNWDKIADKLGSFIDSYNSVIEKSADSDSTGVLTGASSMAKSTYLVSNMLSKAGISVGSDNKLSLDKDALKSADISDLKSLFSGTGSYAYGISSNASQIQSSASSTKATYTSDGTVNQTMSSIMNMYT